MADVAGMTVSAEQVEAAREASNAPPCWGYGSSLWVADFLARLSVTVTGGEIDE